MSLLGKRRLGVSSTSPFTPQQPRPNYQVPIHPATEDIEDLELLIRSIADELERAETAKAKAKGAMSTREDSWSSGSGGTRSPDLLATPVSAADSDPPMGLDTPPPMRDTQDSPTSLASSGRGGLDKAQQSNSRPKERSQATSTSTSKSKVKTTTTNDKVKREKSAGKSQTETTSEKRAQATRTRSRREGLDDSKGEKEPLKRTEMQTYLRVALLCMYTHVPLGWANTQI